MVGVVMQTAGARAAGDDGRIGKTAGSLTKILMRELGLDLEFMDTGSDESEKSQEAVPGDAAGFAEE